MSFRLRGTFKQERRGNGSISELVRDLQVGEKKINPPRTPRERKWERGESGGLYCIVRGKNQSRKYSILVGKGDWVKEQEKTSSQKKSAEQSTIRGPLR